MDNVEVSEPRREELGEVELDGDACNGCDGSDRVGVMSKRYFKLVSVDLTVSLTIPMEPKLAGAEVPESRQIDRLAPCISL